MAEYKKKKVKHKSHKIKKERTYAQEPVLKRKKSFRKNKAEKETIVENDSAEQNFDFSDDKKAEDSASLKVVKGKKGERFKNTVSVFLSIAILVLLIVFAYFYLPANIIESIKYTIYSIGGSEYPIEYSGSVIEDCVQPGSYYYVLTDTSVYSYSRKGKEIFSFSHGFSSPMLSVSSSRALVYDQGSNRFLIFNSSGLIYESTTEQNIINAAVGMNGAYAVVTESPDYASTVTVYTKNNQQLYMWNSVKDIINNVCISPFSKKVAVSTLNASGGEYVSKIFVLNFNSADPVFTADFETNPVYALRATYDGFAAAINDKYCWFDWDNYKRNDIVSSDKQLSFYKAFGNKTVALFNRENDKTDNSLKVISSNGRVLTDISFKGNVSDFCLYGSNVYILSDAKIFVFNKDAKLIKSATCSYGADKIAVCDSSTVVLISTEGLKTEEINGDK